MAVVEENRKNLPLALTYRKEYEAWKDSLNDQNKVWAIAEVEKKFAIKQKQKEVNVLAAENKVKIAERNGFTHFFGFIICNVWGRRIFLQTKTIRNSKIILAQKKSVG
jgi:hypothetical protein